MADQAGTAYIPVRPDFSGFHHAIQNQISQSGHQIGQALANAIQRGMAGHNFFQAFQNQQNQQQHQAPRQGDQTAGAFARGFERRLRAAARSLPDIEVDADTSEADRDLAALRVRMIELSEKTIGVDVDAATALAEMAAIEAEAQRLRSLSPNIQVQADIANAVAQLQAVRAEAERLERERATVQIDADIAAARARLQQLQLQVQRLRTQQPTVQVQADIAAAMLQMEAVQAELAQLEADRANIQVDADTAGANTQLAFTEHQARELDGKHVGINVGADVGGALASLASVRLAIAGLGVLAGPQIVAIGAGLAGLAGPLTAAGAGFGGMAAVAAPAIGRVSEALKAQDAANKQSAGSAGQAQQRALQQAGAAQQLAAAVRQAAAAHAQALEQVRQGEQQLETAQRSRTEAQRALAAAERDAARAAQDLQNQVIDAGLSLRADEIAVERAKLALDQLTSAREDALQVQKAQAALQAAQARAASVAADPAATDAQRQAAKAAVDQAAAAVKAAEAARKARELDRREAQLAYEQAVQRLKEQRVQLARLTADEAQARKAGVEGSDAVRAARQQLADANRRVSDSERALANARANVARVDAQSADQVASARRAAAGAALSGASANNALATSMAALSPLERQLMVAWQGLTKAFNAWALALQPAVLPLFIQGIDLLKGALPLLTPIVLAAAGAVRGLLTQLGQFLKSPLFTQFAASLAQMAGPAITAFGQIGLNAARAVIGLVNAFAPVGQAFLKVLVQISGAFANFAISLTSNPAFQQFVQSVIQILGQMATSWSGIFAQLAPIAMQLYQALAPVIDALRQGLMPVITSLVPVVGLLVGAISKILVALAPVLVVVGQFVAQLISQLLPVLTPIVQAIAQMAAQVGGLLIQALRDSAPALQQMVLAVASLLPALLPLLPLFTQLAQIVLPLLPLVLQLAAVLVTALLPVLQLVIAVLVKAVQVIAAVLLPVVRLLAATLTWLVGVLTPIIQAIGVGLRWLGSAATWLWENAIKPAFSAIATLAQWLYTAVVVALVAPIVISFKVIAAVAMWLWRSVISPVFNGIAKVISAVWSGAIRPVLVAVGSFLKGVFAPVWRWLYSNVIKPVMDWVGGKIRDVWRSLISPAFNAIKSGLGTVADTFRSAVGWIAKHWDGLKNAAKKPIQFVVDTVFNKGVVRMWNSVAKLVPGTKKLNEIHFRRGGVMRSGVMPGWSPGRDIHHFMSPTGGALALAGGESVMVPEWTAAVGERWVRGMNYLARTKGSRAVVQALGLAGDPSGLPTSAARPTGAPVQGFFLGGVIDKFVNAGKSFFADGLVNTAKKIVNPLIDAARGAIGGTPFGDLVVGVPRAMLNAIIGKFSDFEGKLGGPGQRAVQLARTRVAARVPYVWGGTDWEHGMDCSALLKLAWERADPKHRTVPRTTYTQRPWLHRIDKPVAGAFGQPHPGHTFMWAGNGKIIEEPYTGATAREVPARHADFWGMPPWLYDDGGWLQPGLSLVANYTRKPEPVLPPGGLDAIAAAARGGDGASHTTYNLYPRTLDLTMADLERLQNRRETLARIRRPR